MCKNYLIILVLICLPWTFQGQGFWRQDEMEVKIFLQDPSEAAMLENSGYMGEIYLQNGYGLYYLVPSELEQIAALGLQYERIRGNLKEYSQEFWKSRDGYHTYDEIIATIDSLALNFPTICSKHIFGSSVEGRQLCALKISDNAETDEPEPEIMFDGGIHGDEIGGSENLVRFAEMLCDSYGNDPVITGLIDSREIWLYLMVNPDGRVNLVRYNSNGVDLNRDWGYMWNATGSSPEYYSQPETRAIRDCILSNNFALEITYHSGLVFLAYTWSYRPDTCPDHATVHHLAGIYAAESGYSGLPFEQGYNGMYQINGSSKDANYGSMGSVSWTMEISTDKQPPPSQIQYYYDLNEPAMIAMIEQAGYGISGVVSDAVTGLPVAASVFVDDRMPCYTDPSVGDYHKYLPAGNYTVTAVANGYQPVTQSVTIPEGQTSLLNFQLQPFPGHYAYRVVACRIPIDNFADEGRTDKALRSPDQTRYSLGRYGWIILDMQEMIPDGPGDEFTVVEGDSDPEGYSCLASSSPDGPWYLLGSGIGTASFDLGIAGLDAARYIRIEDDGDGPVSGDNTGFDLDALSVTVQPEMIFLKMDCLIMDQEGNGNQRIDPGETFDLEITLRNLGSMPLENGLAWLNTGQGWLSAAEDEVAFGNILPGDSMVIVYSLTCNYLCPPGDLLMMALNIRSASGPFLQSFAVNYIAGALSEDFETVGFNSYEWVMGGDKPWAISFIGPYEGICSAKSGNVDDGESSVLQITMDVIGYDDLSFYRKLSSEPGSDYLRFYIDNVLAGEWSGTSDWEKEAYAVTPGYHTFKWIYQKDGQGSAGADAAWLDALVFPSSNTENEFRVLANANPPWFCGSGESHLGTLILGGSGQYQFEWQPASLLTDSTLQFPLANIDSTIVFEVMVDDGTQQAASSIQVKAGLSPQKADIIQQGDSLISSAMSGNQWYSFGGPIAGAVEKVFYPETEGAYFVMVTGEENCLSDTSNIIQFIFTGTCPEARKDALKVYPNPSTGVLYIESGNPAGQRVLVTLSDMTGRVIIMEKMEKRNRMSIPTIDLDQGMYFITVKGEYDQDIYTGKIIVE